MDTSKEYILMCEKAVEIQTIWKKDGTKSGDFIKVHGYEICVISSHEAGAWSDHWIWIPRQDQLQEMAYDGKIKSFPVLQWSFYLFLLERNEDWRNIRKRGDDEKKYSSFEKVWLSYLMRHKFNKTWNGEDWING